MSIEVQTRTLEALKPLVGLPLWAGGRAANLIWLQFGSKRKVLRRSVDQEVGDFALHIQCFWRLCNAQKIIVASGDRFYPRGDPFKEAEDFDWTEPHVNRCDEKLEAIFQSVEAEQLIVQAVRSDKYGGFRLFFRSSLKLEVYIDDTVATEKWRFFRPYSDEGHFIVSEVN